MADYTNTHGSSGSLGPASSQGPVAPSEGKKLEGAPWSPWETTERERPLWTPQNHFGKRVLPLLEQNNNDIPNEQVLQPRDEPVGKSAAFPINGREFGSTEATHKLNTHSDTRHVPL
jgi:hypothetical protein